METSNNSWLVWCEPLNRALSHICQSDIPKAIEYYRAQTGKLPKYIAVAPQKNVEFVVPEDIELIIETGLSGWEIRLAAQLPFPENRWNKSYLENRGERGKAGLAEAIKNSDNLPPAGEQEAAAAPPNISDNAPSPENHVSKIGGGIKSPTKKNTRLKIDSTNYETKSKAKKVKIYRPRGRPLVPGACSKSTLWRHAKKAKHLENQPVLI